MILRRFSFCAALFLLLITSPTYAYFAGDLNDVDLTTTNCFISNRGTGAYSMSSSQITGTLNIKSGEQFTIRATWDPQPAACVGSILGYSKGVDGLGCVFTPSSTSKVIHSPSDVEWTLTFEDPGPDCEGKLWLKVFNGLSMDPCLQIYLNVVVSEPPPPPNELVLEMDVIQTIQDPVKYVTGKAISVRGYVTCPGCEQEIYDNVFVKLTADWGPERSNQEYTRKVTLTPGESAVDLRDNQWASFNFSIPPDSFSLTSGPQVLDLTLFTEMELFGETKTTTITKSITIHYVKPLKIEVKMLEFVNSDSTVKSEYPHVYEIWDQICNASEFLRMLFPGKTSLNFNRKNLLTHDITGELATQTDGMVTLDPMKLLLKLERIKNRDRFQRYLNLVGNEEYTFAMWFDTLNNGYTVIKPPNEGFWWENMEASLLTAHGNSEIPEMAHMVGHLMGLQHPGITGNTSTQFPNYIKGECDSLKKTPTGANEWTYSDAKTHVYGFTPQFPEQVVPSTTYSDFMSYCDFYNADPLFWFGTDVRDPHLYISNIHYNKIVEAMVTASVAAASEVAADDNLLRKVNWLSDKNPVYITLDTNEYYVASAIVHADDTVTSFEITHLTGTVQLPRSAVAATSTNYCVETQDNVGTTLDTQCFELNFSDHTSDTTPVSRLIMGNMNYGASVSKVVIKKGATVLATINKSSGTPSVTDITITDIPENATEKKICWTGSDTDGDSLTYTVQYSADGGSTWIVLNADLTGSCYTVDLAGLEASTAGQFRVIASDTFNENAPSVAATTVVVDDTAPEIILNHATKIFNMSAGDNFLLSASAFDKEDGEIASSSIVWTDDTGTTIGTADALVSISQETQTYTVTATDSAGNSNSITVILNIAKADINGDGNITLGDAILALQVSAKIEPSSVIYTQADVNMDDRIGLEEAIYVLQAVSGVRSLFSIQSSAFTASNPIPSKYSCDGTDVSPPLSWQSVPEGTQSFVLIMDDPDAPGGTWDHWIVYNIPASVTSLAENAGASGGGNLPSGASHGINSWPNTYYQGPCPPSGTHRYFFKLYSLSVEQLNPTGTSKAEIEVAMAGKILGQTELIGTYTYTP